MIRTVSFQAKARTVDHLGREQIADSPTAISELWKNSFDAYARVVALDIFDGGEPVAVISDDGHGMSRLEFEQRWLVVGTESKATDATTPAIDRNGLRVRARQGQKGIGRLSCANLGSILLLISKRRDEQFVAALIDWRLFENPYVNLADIQIPIVEFASLDGLLAALPELKQGLRHNVVFRTDANDGPTVLLPSWMEYDALVQKQHKERGTRGDAPSKLILGSIDNLSVEARHLEQWPVWSGAADHGTALVISNINYDLRIELDEGTKDTAARDAQDRFFETLTSFVDPFVDPAESGTAASRLEFSYVVRSWTEDVARTIVSAEKQFDRRVLDAMEHLVVGSVDPNGVFTGRIRAFGQAVNDVCVIEPPLDLAIPKRPDTSVGPFDLYIASMEFLQVNSTHPPMEFSRFQELAARYSGFMIFRDGLRVLPYGRTDNDFFEIESRRSKNAGREFWNHRQMFGRLAVTRNQNPNLKDKAGREGLLDNRAAKTLKALVANILRTCARRYFGSDSNIRGEKLPEIKATNLAEKAKENRNRLRQRQRKEFRSKLQSFAPQIADLNQEMTRFAAQFSVRDEDGIDLARERIEIFRQKVAELKLSGAPKALGPLEEKYDLYRDDMRTATQTLDALARQLDEEVERLRPAKPRALLEKQIARASGQLSQRITQWKRSIDALQRAEFERIREMVKQRNKLFHEEAIPVLARFDRGEVPYLVASKQLQSAKDSIEEANGEIFGPYIGALESLKESIDLEHLATFGMDEVNDLRSELERLNSLAQLGIAVEIVGHELQAYDDIIGAGVRALPESVRGSKAVRDIEFGYDGLTDQLRFLSPLRLSGQRIQRWISGQEIAEYIGEFFRLLLSKNRISFSSSDRFLLLKIFDQQSRLYPVFINLINNSIYWVATLPPDRPREIVLDVVDDEVVVSDSGPGVDPEDRNSLFSLFFTKKSRGGRGVGLYLVRANLAAGGHRIRYEAPSEKLPLAGANFVISFRGIEFDGA